MHFSYGRNPDFCLSVTLHTDMECVRPAGRTTPSIGIRGTPKEWVPYKFTSYPQAQGGEPSYSVPAAAYYTTMIYLFCSLVIILNIILHAVYDPQTNNYHFSVCDPQTIRICHLNIW